VRSEGDLGAFFHRFLLEATAMARAHAAALGANALLSFHATPEESQTGRNQVRGGERIAGVGGYFFFAAFF
jgi:hypothetical protein